MKLPFGVLLLLLIWVLFNQANKRPKEVDLNFFQNDYKIKFERTVLVRYNNNLVENMSIKTFKYNRSIAVLNATFILKADLGNDFVVVSQSYKFMSNEYREFPVHFAASVCTSLAANVCGIRTGFMTCGNLDGCPMVKGKKYEICNWHPDESKLPPFMPNGEYKVEMQMMHLSSEVFVAEAYATIFRPIV